jgi:hypothetical protein
MNDAVDGPIFVKRLKNQIRIFKEQRLRAINKSIPVLFSIRLGGRMILISSIFAIYDTFLLNCIKRSKLTPIFAEVQLPILL